MSKFIIGFLIGSLLVSGIVHAKMKQEENISNFTDDQSLATLNEQLRQIRATLDDHEQRLVAGGH